MLDRRYTHAVFLQHGCHARVANTHRIGWQAYRWGDVDATKHDPCIDWRRTHREFDAGAAMQADTRGLDSVSQRSLSYHFLMKLSCDQYFSLHVREHGFDVRYFKLAGRFYMQL